MSRHASRIVSRVCTGLNRFLLITQFHCRLQQFRRLFFQPRLLRWRESSHKPIRLSPSLGNRLPQIGKVFLIRSRRLRFLQLIQFPARRFRLVHHGHELRHLLVCRLQRHGPMKSV